jgi:hypothetical protein
MPQLFLGQPQTLPGRQFLSSTHHPCDGCFIRVIDTPTNPHHFTLGPHHPHILARTSFPTCRVFLDTFRASAVLLLERCWDCRTPANGCARGAIWIPSTLGRVWAGVQWVHPRRWRHGQHRARDRRRDGGHGHFWRVLICLLGGQSHQTVLRF